MNENIVSKTKKLVESYLAGDLSLKEFQFQLEPLLGSFDHMSKEDAELVKKIDNQLERIIYTIPESFQKAKVQEIIPEIFSYVKNKTDNLY